MSQEQPTNEPLAEILHTGPLEHSSRDVPPVAIFKPWHLPRKQHVRQEQWGKALERLIDELPDRHMINYLCLPGEDLLDIQVLADVCQRKERRLQYIGFDNGEGANARSTQRIAAEQILRQNEVVENSSEVITDSFDSLARLDSVGSRRLRDRGSYDVVNLDMCDSFTSQPQVRNHDAMLSLLNHQSHQRGVPWLLFLTTHAEIDRLQPGEVEIYDKRILENIQQSIEFREYIARMLGAEFINEAALVAGVQDRRVRDAGFSGRWLTLGIGKWLLGIMAQDSPWRVDLLSVYCYRTGLLSDQAETYASEPPNLFSLAFRLEKIRQPRPDPTRLANTDLVQGVLNETQLAQKMARCVAENTLDLDIFIQERPDLGARLLVESELLLATRYYSRDAYRATVNRLPRVGGRATGAEVRNGELVVGNGRCAN